MTLVSIVIPCFRQGRWLAQAVESCLGQSHRRLEVIVVDDGSDDDTAAVSQGFGERIRYIHQTNAGQSPARNAGLKVCRGEYVLFLDADDALHPDAVAKLLSAADTRTLAMMGWKPFEHDVAEPGTDVFPPQADPIPALLRNNPGPPHIMLSPRGSLENIGGWDAELSGTSDWDCWYRQLFAGAGLRCVPFIGAYYRQSPGQLSRNELVMTENLARASDKLLALARKHPERLRAWGLDPAATVREFRRRAAREHAHLAWLRRERGQRRAAAKEYFRAALLGHAPAWKGLLSLGRPA